MRSGGGAREDWCIRKKENRIEELLLPSYAVVFTSYCILLCTDGKPSWIVPQLRYSTYSRA